MEIKLLSEKAKVPTRGSNSAAGYDLYAAETVDIKPGETMKISTDIAMAIPEGYFGAIYARSGLATKSGLRPANCVGVVDADYRGAVIVPLYNDSSESRIVNCGDRIAQIIITPYLAVDFNVVDDLDDTGRGSGGFGHTGL